MLKEEELKSQLQSIALNDFKPAEGMDIETLIPDMLFYIGSPDSDLRDELIYSAFGNWILEHELVSPDTLRKIAATVITEQHIFYRIGETGTDSVFRRSFSMLLLPLILIYHRSHPILSCDEIFQIKDNLILYQDQERDFRGYVDGKGWAHAPAHYADALDDLTRCEEISRLPDLRKILAVVSNLVCHTDAAFCWGEDDRFATVVIAILGRQLFPGEELDTWVQSLADAALSENEHPKKMILRVNIQNFLRALSFRVRWEFPDCSLLPTIDHALFRISPYTKK